VTPNSIRAQVSAIFQLVINLLGLGIGPTLVAFLTDKVFAEDLAVGKSLAIVVAICGLLAAILVALGLHAYRDMLKEASGWGDASDYIISR
jgi:MFS family permease